MRLLHGGKFPGHCMHSRGTRKDIYPHLVWSQVDWGSLPMIFKFEDWCGSDRCQRSQPQGGNRESTLDQQETLNTLAYIKLETGVSDCRDSGLSVCLHSFLMRHHEKSIIVTDLENFCEHFCFQSDLGAGNRVAWVIRVWFGFYSSNRKSFLILTEHEKGRNINEMKETQE